MPGGVRMSFTERHNRLTTRKYNLVFEWILEHSSTPEIDDLHDSVLVDHDVVKLQIPMCQTHAVEVCHSVQDL